MPHLKIETNVPKEKIPANAAKELVSLVAKILSKPENYVCVTIVPDRIMNWGGSDEPCGQASLMSIGQLGTKENIKYSKVLFEKINQLLGIPPTKLYIHFQNAPSADVGYNGTTFYEIFGG